MFFEPGVKGASSFTDVELSAFCAMNDVYNVVRQAVELLSDVHLGLRASKVGAGANEGICSIFCLIAWSGPWCFVCVFVFFFVFFSQSRQGTDIVVHA